MPSVVRKGITQLKVHHLLSLRSRIATIIRKVVTLRLTMTHRHRTIDAMTVETPREARLRVEKIILLVDVKFLIVVA